MRKEQNWPRFELVTYAEPTGIPNGWDHELITIGVPKRMLGRYNPVDRLGLVEHPTLGPVVRFATVGRKGAMCLHPATYSIHYLTGTKSGKEWFVNTTLARFNDAVRAVINRFPFDHGVLSDAPIQDTSTQRFANHVDRSAHVEWVSIGEELRELLRRIDPESVADPNGYWNTFVADVQMGDYSTEDVLSLQE